MEGYEPDYMQGKKPTKTPKCKMCGGRQGAPTNPNFSAGAHQAGFKTYGKINPEGLCRPCAAGKAELERQGLDTPEKRSSVFRDRRGG